MNFSLHQIGVVMSSRTTHTHTHTVIKIPAHIYLTPEPWFSVVAPFLQFIPTASCNGIPPLCRWWPPDHGRAVRKNTGPSKNVSVKLIKFHTYLASPLFLMFRALSCSLHRHSSVAVIILLPLTSAINTLLAIRYTHPFFSHAQTITILSDLLYWLTPFMFQLSYTPLHS